MVDRLQTASRIQEFTVAGSNGVVPYPRDGGLRVVRGRRALGRRKLGPPAQGGDLLRNRACINSWHCLTMSAAGGSFIHVAVGVWHNVCWGGLHKQCMTLSESGSNINSSINEFICMRQQLYRGCMIHMYCCTHMRRRIPNTIHYQLMLAFAAFVDMYAACGIQWRRRPPLSSNANKYAQHSTWALSNGVLAPPQYLPPRRERCCATLVSLASPPGLHIPAANRNNAAIAVARMCGRPAWAKTLLSPVFVATCRAPPTDANRPQPCVSFARLCYDTLEFEARVGASDHGQHDVSHITSADPLLPSRHAPTSDPTLCAWRG